VPKFGFKNPFRVEYHGINLDSLQALVDEKKITTIDMTVLVDNGMASKNERIKILGRGELKSKLDVKAHAFSASAKTAIESKGGTTSIIEA
ncbi:MAG: uL15 family ribosomal protein, partial [Bacteroidota bacterium]